MSVSIVMTTFNRPHLLRETLDSIDMQDYQDEIIVVDDGTDELTEGICREYLATYIKLNRPQSETYRNQAWPLNVGIRAATGDIIIQQNAECKHIDPKTIEKLTARVTDTNCVFARVTALLADGTPDILYCGIGNARPYFFCGAIKRAWFEKLRGYDEDFVGYGYEDDDMAERLSRSGVTWDFTDIEVHHQWHPPAGVFDMSQSANLFAKKSGSALIRNQDRQWGDHEIFHNHSDVGQANAQTTLCIN